MESDALNSGASKDASNGHHAVDHVADLNDVHETGDHDEEASLLPARVVPGPSARTPRDDRLELSLTAVQNMNPPRARAPHVETDAEMRMYIQDRLMERAQKDFGGFGLSKDSLRLLAEETTNRFRLELDVNMNFSKDPDSDQAFLDGAEISQRLGLTGFRFQQFLDRIKVLEDERLLEHRKEMRRVALAEKEASNLEETNVRRLQSSESVAGPLPADLVKNMLDVGFEEHLKLIRRFIFGDNPYGVTVAFKDLTVSQGVRVEFEDENMVLKHPTGPPTFGTKALGCALCLCYAGLSIHKRCTHKSDLDDPRVVQAFGGKKPRIERLKSASGVFKPGEITLLLGPPHAGKTQLLHAVASKIKARGARKVSGDVWYNGRSSKTLFAQNFCTVVDQVDTHIPKLTVRETITFAYKCRGMPSKAMKRKSKDPETLEKIARNRVDLIMAVLGLTRVADTLIGNDVIKGVSGGEMRRVTLAEMLVVGNRVLLLDEISTGLDSAATYDITKSLRALARVFNTTVVVALLQPPPETFEIFDNICMMADGRIVYQGPRGQVEDHFKSLNITRTVSSGSRTLDLADFLIEATSSTPENAARFAEAFRASELGVASANAVEAASTMQTDHPWEQTLLAAGRYKRSWRELLVVVTKRQFAVMLRNRAYIKARVAQNVLFSLVIGALFYQIPFSQWYLVSMVLGQLCSFTGFSTIALITDVVSVRNVFYKQSREAFFPASVYVMADYLVGLPFSLLDAFLLGTVTYFMSGLSHTDNGAPYFLFLVFLIAYSVCMGCQVRMCAYTSRDSSSASGLAVLLVVIALVFSGTIATPEVIPPWFIWLYWGFSPYAWVYRSLMQSQFHSSKYTEECESGCPNNLQGQCLLSCNVPPCSPPYPDQNCGDFFLSARQMQTDPIWLWLGIIAVLVFTWLFFGLSVLALNYVRHDDTEKGVVDVVIKSDGAIQSPAQGQRDLGKTPSATSPAALASHHGDPVETAPTPKSPITGGSTGKKLPPKWQALFDADGPSPVLMFKNVRYTIDLKIKEDQSPPSASNPTVARQQTRRRNNSVMPVDLLKDISGFAKPFEMTALMGSSGAGKTTLMDVLSFRKTMGTVEGEFTFGKGRPWSKRMSSKLGYIEQFGMHRGTATVREALHFSARLRIPGDRNVPEVRDYLVDRVVRILELEKICDALVQTLSFEETKRLTIGVELVAWPRIVFADEPTSGLTSHEAMVTMEALARVAALGKPVVCTIHQPSYQIFERFHRLLLLKRGGQVVFFGKLGEGAQNLVDYFTAIPGVVPIQPGVNPASWMLDIIGAGVGSKNSSTFDFAEIYAFSELKRANDLEMEELEREMRSELTSTMRGSFMNRDSPEGPSNIRDIESAIKSEDEHYLSRSVVADDPDDDPTGCTQIFCSSRDKPEDSVGEYPTSHWTQFKALLERELVAIWRNPAYSFSRGVILLFVSLLTGLTFLQRPMYDAASVQSRVSVMTLILILSGNFNANMVAPLIFAKRASFYRERSSKMFPGWIFALAAGFAEDPYLLLQLFVNITVFYFAVGFVATANLFFYYLFIMFFFVEVTISIASLNMAIFANPAAAILVSTLIVQFASLFSGVFVPGNVMPTWLLFLYYVSPTRWAQEGLVVTQFKDDLTVICYPTAATVLTWAPGEAEQLCPDTTSATASPFYFLEDAGLNARCCEPSTAFPITAASYVLHGQTYGNFTILPWLGGPNGFKVDFWGYDYLYLTMILIILRTATVLATNFISHQKR